jgi:lipid A 3-O-deacylase
MLARTKAIIFLLLVFLLQVPAHAEVQELNTEGNFAGPSDVYVKDRLSAQFVAGALFTPVAWVKSHTTFNYVQTDLRFGWMASEPSKTKYFGMGNFELLFELTNSFIYEGPGNYMRGFTLLGRYNLLLSNPRWATYIQVGVGAVVNDVYEDMSQNSVGQAIEFTPQMSIGLRHFIARHWTMDLEAMFHHVSNAHFSDRNNGINAVGGFLGVTYFFDQPRH